MDKCWICRHKELGLVAFSQQAKAIASVNAVLTGLRPYDDLETAVHHVYLAYQQHMGMCAFAPADLTKEMITDHLRGHLTVFEKTTVPFADVATGKQKKESQHNVPLLSSGTTGEIILPSGGACADGAWRDMVFGAAPAREPPPSNEPAVVVAARKRLEAIRGRHQALWNKDSDGFHMFLAFVLCFGTMLVVLVSMVLLYFGPLLEHYRAQSHLGLFALTGLLLAVCILAIIACGSTLLFYYFGWRHSKKPVLRSPEERAERLLDHTDEQLLDDIILRYWLVTGPCFYYIIIWPDATFNVQRAYDELKQQDAFKSATAAQQERFVCLRVLHRVITNGMQ
jgi:hypothetical protein